MIGTIVNIIAIIVGSILGLLFHSRFPKKISVIVFQAIGLFTLFLGMSMAFKTNNVIIMIFSMLIGSILGEWIDLEKHMERFSKYIKKKVKSKDAKFTEGMVTATLIYCVGSMAILGSIEEGLGMAPTILLAKSVLDGFVSIALASAMGIGVMFSIIPLFIYQGGLTLFASYLQNFFTEVIINELTAVGGLMLLGLGLNLLEIKKIKVLNMLPSLVVAVILAAIFL